MSVCWDEEGERKSPHVSAVYVQWRTGGGGGEGQWEGPVQSTIQPLPPSPLLCASAWQNGNMAAPRALAASAPLAPVSQGAAGEWGGGGGGETGTTSERRSHVTRGEDDRGEIQL